MKALLFAFKETNINFSIVSSLSVSEHVYAILEFKSKKWSYSKYRLCPHPFCEEMFTYLDRAKKKVKSLKTENFNQTPEKRTPPNRRQFWADP